MVISLQIAFGMCCIGSHKHFWNVAANFLFSNFGCVSKMGEYKADFIF